MAQAGFCPATTLTIPVRLSPSAEMAPAAAAVFPIGSLPLGTYTVTVTFPDQTVVNPQTQQPTSWTGSRVSATLHIGSTFTETDTSVLVRAGKSDRFALLLDNSIAGRGAGQLVSTKTENPSIAKLSGTEYYPCGTIAITAIVTYGKRGADGVSRVTGKGGIIGGT